MSEFDPGGQYFSQLGLTPTPQQIIQICLIEELIHRYRTSELGVPHMYSNCE